MKPLLLLETRVDEHLVDLLEHEGFTFSRSQMRFTRTVGYARQRITFSRSRHNHDDHCAFWTMWGVDAPSYGRWHQAQRGARPVNTALGGCAEWNIPGWSRRPENHYLLRNHHRRDATEMQAFGADVQRVGLPYLDAISTWEGAAQQLVENRSGFDRAADFLLIAGQSDRARQVIEAGIDHLCRPGAADPLGELPRLRARLDASPR